jgi:MFS transporter, SP family, solute carrier family 2 (facilitated glucose transporter), member 6
MLSSANFTVILIARVFAGVPAGGCFILIPMYIKEISQDNIRGSLVALGMLFQNLGILAMYGMGSYLEYYTILWIAVCIPILTIIFMIMAPESPAFLMKTEQVEVSTLL